MISIAECFQHIDFNNCVDVASSLGFDGIPDEIEIPIYEIFTLHIMPASKANFMADSIEEFGALQKTCQATGGIVAGINIAGVDMLTILSVLLNTSTAPGFNIFYKLNVLDLADMSSEIVQYLADACNIPIDTSLGVSPEMVENIVQTVVDRLMQFIQHDVEQYNINLYSWEQFPEYFEMAKASGELQQMYQYRLQLGARNLNQ